MGFPTPRPGNGAFTKPILKPRINNQITAPTLRVVDEAGQAVGVLTRDEALRAAKERGTDLIEISPTATPPVAKLLSWDKYRYQQEKAEKKERAASRASGESKQIQISARAAAHDLEIRLKKLEEFLAEGVRVDIQMRLRGREKGNKAWAMTKFQEFLGMIKTEYRIISPIKPAGNGFHAQISKK